MQCVRENSVIVLLFISHSSLEMTNNENASSVPTPGPWTFDYLDPKYCHSNEMFRIDSYSDFPSIADVFSRNTDEEANANASLFAAAPELLEACEIQLENWKSRLAGDWELNHDSLKNTICRLKK